MKKGKLSWEWDKFIHYFFVGSPKTEDRSTSSVSGRIRTSYLLFNYVTIYPIFSIAIIFFLLPFIGYNQTITENSFILSGTVVNGINNQPLAGSHLLTTRNTGTKTNELGEFTIIVYPKDTLKISYIGFKTVHYIVPYKESGKYLIKFKLFTDSVALSEINIFPWPTYEEFKQAFITMDKQNEAIKMEGVKMYQDRTIEPWDYSLKNLIRDKNIASFMYDKLLDKQAKLRRRLERRRNTIKDSMMDD